MKNILNKLELDNKKILLIILGFLIIVYLDFSFLLNFQLNRIKTSEPKIIKLKKELETLGKDLAKMKDLRSEQLKGEDKPLFITRKIISKDGVSSVLQDISDIADKNNVKIIKMQPVLAKVAPGQKQKDLEKDSKEKDRFNPLFLNLNIICDYHRLGYFINDLENAAVLFAVKDLKITTQPKDPLKQKVDLVLKIYVKK
jgi:Tfp pilus assembly protein PilO